MSFHKELSSEQLPRRDYSSTSPRDEDLAIPIADVKHMSEEELTEKLEAVLLERIEGGDVLALFQLGQLYYEQDEYEKACEYFERGSEKGDIQCMFQLSVVLYDGLHGNTDQKRGFELMTKVAESTSKMARHLKFAAHYNLGRAYFQGCGVKQNDAQAEKHWLVAADDGNPRASVKAQTTLGLYYAHEDFKDLKKAFFWHSEACGNNSLESQGALGVMYLNGLGCKKDMNSAFICLREAAERGNVYAMGHLVAYYYRRKLYTKTIELAARVSQFTGPEQIASETDCLPSFIAKGIAMASFYYARCLHMGFGVKKNEDMAKQFYSKCYQFDAAICAQLQNSTQRGEI